MPAWSVPGSHSVMKPRMRCQRTMMSICVWLSMWPMCRRPVTFGGGNSRVNTGRVSPSRRRGHGEEFLFDPVLGPARFNRARLVGFGQFVRHGEFVVGN